MPPIPVPAAEDDVENEDNVENVDNVDNVDNGDNGENESDAEKSRRPTYDFTDDEKLNTLVDWYYESPAFWNKKHKTYRMYKNAAEKNQTIYSEWVKRWIKEHQENPDHPDHPDHPHPEKRKPPECKYQIKLFNNS